MSILPKFDQAKFIIVLSKPDILLNQFIEHRKTNSKLYRDNSNETAAVFDL
jgi:hypothetical protein